jgi:thiol-disulfide isomerase/thioredoxin
MKTRILVLILIFVSLSFANTMQTKAGEIKLLSEYPKAEQELVIHYTADDRFVTGEPLMAFIYLSIEGMTSPKAYQLNLSYDATRKYYAGNYKIPEKAQFGLIAISNGERLDANNFNFWSFFVFDSNGSPAEGAYLKAGISYLGVNPGNCSPNVDYEKAMDYLKNETKLYTSNIQAKIGLSSLKFDLRKLDREDFENELDNMIHSDYDKTNENDVKAVSRALRTLGKSEEAKELEKSFAKKNQKSDLAEEMYLAALSDTKSMKSFSTGVREFLKQFPKSSNRERVFSAWVSSYIQAKRYKEIVGELKLIDDVPATAYSRLAFAVIEDVDLLKGMSETIRAGKAKELIEMAILEANKPKQNRKPDSETVREWDVKRKLLRASMYESKGMILRQGKKLNEAMSAFQKSIEVFPDYAGVVLYVNMIETARGLEDHSKVLSIATKAIENSKYNAAVVNYYQEAYEKLGKAGSYETEIKKLEESAKYARLDALEWEMQNKEAELGVVKNMKGKRIDLSTQKNKVIVLVFWSTWCGPCNETISSIDGIYKKYEKNDDIIFAAVNIWEETSGKERDETIRDFFGDSFIDIPILVDVDNELATNLGITGLPSQAFIDKSGKLQFLDAGFIDDESYYRDFEDKIDLLLKMRK